MKRFRNWVMPILLTLGILGGGAAIAAQPAGATGSLSIDYNGAYANAPYSGTPLVATYHGYTSRDNFVIVGVGSAETLISNNGGTDTGCYVGDYQNSQTSARLGLTCNTVPWGADIEFQTCATGGSAIWDPHWSGWWVPGSANGDSWYANSATAYCFHFATH